MRALVLATALVALLAACGGGDDDKQEAVTAAQLCAAATEVLGNIASPDIIETSGIAASRENEGVLWLHNDSGDSARVFAIDRGGALLGTYALDGAQAIDWEDMAIGPGPDEGVDYLHLADIGDNDAIRDEIAVYRVPEPDAPSRDPQYDPEREASLTGVEKLVLRYPDRAHDAETLLVDPLSGDLIIVTKDVATGMALVFRGDTAAPVGQPQTLEQVATIDFALYRDQIQARPDAPALVAGVPHIPTAGDVSADGALVVIRTYGAVFVWERPDGAPLWEAFAREPCQAPSAIEQQGEAIAFDADGKGYLTVSEGENAALNHFAVR